MNAPLRTITTAMQIYRENDDPIYGETCTTIRIEDDAAGWYFVLEANKPHEDGGIALELDELRALLACAEQMAKQEPKE